MQNFLIQPPIGVLANEGYKVGKQGPSFLKRHIILRKIWLDDIRDIGSKGYMRSWGKKGSKKRLNKILNCLYGFANDPIHKNHDDAISDWNSDYEWLIEESKKYNIL